MEKHASDKMVLMFHVNHSTHILCALGQFAKKIYSANKIQNNYNIGAIDKIGANYL